MIIVHTHTHTAVRFFYVTFIYTGNVRRVSDKHIKVTTITRPKKNHKKQKWSVLKFSLKVFTHRRTKPLFMFKEQRPLVVVEKSLHF